MSKLLIFELQHSNPLPFVLINTELAINQIMEREFYKDSLIYFICKVKKVRIDMDTVSETDPTSRIILLYEGKKIKTDFNICNSRGLKLQHGSNSKKLILSIDGPNKLPHPIIITPDFILREKKIEIGNKPKILYIGYSFEPIERLQSHEKIIKAINELDDNEELRLYVCSFKYSYLETLPDNKLICVDGIGIKKDIVEDSVLKDYIKLTERVFINFFQTEGLNENHINMDLMKDPLIKNLLHNNDIRYFGGGFEMEDGEYFDFSSDNQKMVDKSFYFDFDNPQDGYITHEEAQKRFLSQ